jgi:UDP:flavonoid glycosyltransferase YjiC (YdhE family)
MAKIDFAWELGGQTGHVTPLFPIAAALKAYGHDIRFLLKDERAAGDLAGLEGMQREGAPHWVAPPLFEDPLSFSEILLNFGYHDARVLRQLVDVWREKLWLSDLVVANFAPTAHVAAMTLGLPSFEISSGFHIPPPVFPVPPLRDWERAPRQRLEEADRRVRGAINEVLGAFGVDPVSTIGDVFAGRALLLTYPELDIYPQRGPADYYGIPQSAEGAGVPAWPAGRGPRVFAYVYNYFKPLPGLLEALARLDAPSLIFCRGADPELRRKYEGTCVVLTEEAMSVSRVVPQCDVVFCHGSHQMTAQALLAGKPVLLASTQLEQFLNTRRVVRFGAGLGIAPDVADPDFAAAISKLTPNSSYAVKAADFARKYAVHDRGEALASMVRRCEAALPQARSSGHRSLAKAES